MPVIVTSPAAASIGICALMAAVARKLGGPGGRRHHEGGQEEAPPRRRRGKVRAMEITLGAGKGRFLALQNRLSPAGTPPPGGCRPRFPADAAQASRRIPPRLPVGCCPGFRAGGSDGSRPWRSRGLGSDGSRPYQARLVGHDRGLNPVAHAELAEHGGDVVLHGRRGSGRARARLRRWSGRAPPAGAPPSRGG